MRLLLLLVLGMFTCNLYAAAGKAVFVFGEVQVLGIDGRKRLLSKNSNVNPGDLIVTGKRAMVQLRMIDKAFIAIRQNSEFRIEAYLLGAKKEEDSGLFSLLKGGFRAITGAIGKRLKDSYLVSSGVATIGIRGTDFTARLCNQDCNSNFGGTGSSSATVADGLYVGVIDGGVDITNDLGSLDLDELQYGYVRDAASAPVALLRAPEFLFFKSRPPDTESKDDEDETNGSINSDMLKVRQAIEPESGDINSDNGIQQDTGINLPGLSPEDIVSTSSFNQSVVTDSGVTISLDDTMLGARRSLVSVLGDLTSSNSASAVTENFSSAMTIDDLAVTRFENDFLDGGSGSHTVGSASTLDLGFDPASGISWGRWATGSANFINSITGGSTAIDLDGRSLHWISGPDRTDIALPLAGTINYQLIGNTSPTDNLGNTGVLGAASLSADFGNMTTSSSVDIGINNQVWNASGTGVIKSNGDFTGTMSVTGADSNNGAFTGSGNHAGFFTDKAEAAGMGYALGATINGTPTNVTGTAAFQK